MKRWRARWEGVSVFLAAMAGCTIEPRTDRLHEEAAAGASEFLKPWGAQAPPAGVKSGDLVWVWGMTGTLPGSVPSHLVKGGVEAETLQAIQNVEDVLEAAGSTVHDVAQCTVFVADSLDLEPMRRVYAEHFAAPPTRVAVAAAPLGPTGSGARVEIECTAVLPTDS